MIIIASAPLASALDRSKGIANSKSLRPSNTNLASRCEGLKSSLRLFARTLATRAITTDDYSVDLIALDDKARRLFAEQVQREGANFESVSAMLEAKNVFAVLYVDGGDPEAVFDNIAELFDVYLNVDDVWQRASSTSSDELIANLLSDETHGGYLVEALGGVPPASIVTSSADCVVVIEDPELAPAVEVEQNEMPEPVIGGVDVAPVVETGVGIGDVVDTPEVVIEEEEVPANLDFLIACCEELYAGIKDGLPDVNEIGKLFASPKRLSTYLQMPALTGKLSIDTQSMIPFMLESADVLAAHFASLNSVNEQHNIEQKEPKAMTNLTELMRVCQEMYAAIKVITPNLPEVSELFATPARIQRYVKFAPVVNGMNEKDRALLPEVEANAEAIAAGFVELGELMKDADATPAAAPVAAAPAAAPVAAAAPAPVAAVVADEDDEDEEEEVAAVEDQEEEEEAQDAEHYARERWPVLSLLLIDGAYQDLPSEETAGLTEVLADGATQMVDLFKDMPINAPFDLGDITEVMDDTDSNQLAAIVGLLMGDTDDFDPLNSGSAEIEALLDAVEESANVMADALDAELEDEDEDEDEDNNGIEPVESSLITAFSELGDDLYRVAELLIPGITDGGVTVEELAAAVAEMCDHNGETVCLTLNSIYRSIEEEDDDFAAVVGELVESVADAQAIDLGDEGDDEEDEDEMGLGDDEDDDEDESDDLRLVNVTIVPRLVLNLSLDNRLHLTEEEILALGCVEGEQGDYDLSIGLNGRTKGKKNAPRGFYLGPIRDVASELAKIANASVLIPQSKLKGDHERLARAIIAALPNGSGGLNMNLRGEERIVLDHEGNITVGFADEEGDGGERVVNFNDLCSLSTNFYVGDNIATGTTIEVTTVLTMFLPRLSGGTKEGRSLLVEHLCKLAVRNAERTGVPVLPAITFLGADAALQDTSGMSVVECLQTILSVAENEDPTVFGIWAGAVGASMSAVMSGEDHGISYLSEDQRIDFDNAENEDEIELIDGVLSDTGAVMLTDAGPNLFALGGDYTVMLVPQGTAESEEEVGEE